MLYREIIAVCSQIHTKYINTLCGQKVELLNVKVAVRIVTTGHYAVNIRMFSNLLLCSFTRKGTNPALTVSRPTVHRQYIHLPHNAQTLVLHISGYSA
jgi:hypothetical protein